MKNPTKDYVERPHELLPGEVQEFGDFVNMVLVIAFVAVGGLVFALTGMIVLFWHPMGFWAFACIAALIAAGGVVGYIVKRTIFGD